MIETSNGRNCRTCNKVNVCKYQDFIDKVDKIVKDVEQLELPLTVNINCIEWSANNTSTISSPTIR